MKPLGKLLKNLFLLWLIQVCACFSILWIDWQMKSVVIIDGEDDIPTFPRNFFPEIQFSLFLGIFLISILLFYLFLKLKKHKEIYIQQKYFVLFIFIGLACFYFAILDILNNYQALNVLSYQKYTSAQIVSEIKNIPDYQGDDFIFFKSGKIQSKDMLIQSVIKQMYIVPDNLNYIKQLTAKSDKPEAYWIYKIAIYHYIQQYPEKTRKNAKE